MSLFAQRLSLLRESKGLKKKELADILNVSAACISQYENGTSMPGHDILLCIAQYFNVSLDFLLGNESELPKFQLSDIFYDNMSYLSLLTACVQIPKKKRQALLSIINALRESSDS